MACSSIYTWFPANKLENIKISSLVVVAKSLIDYSKYPLTSNTVSVDIILFYVKYLTTQSMLILLFRKKELP